VVAAVACYKDQNFQIPDGLEKDFSLIRDSKKLSEKQREKVFTFIEEYFYVGVGIINSETIDRINILQAAFLAMKSAIADLQKQIRKSAEYKMVDIRGEEKFYCLVDGNQTIPNISIKQEAVIGGDGSVKSIAAASIIAKVTRDRMMKNFDREYPKYGFAKHKGYGTREHLDTLRRFGPCPIHRMSFRPVLLSIPENVNRRFSNVLKPIAKTKKS
jgi:ribonuclease HII